MKIYADNAATTKMCPAAIEAMLPFLDRIYGNPSSLHSVGQEAAEALADARQRIAACIGADPGEIVFTSGGSEADNQAILSAARLGRQQGRQHIISTAFEHHAVLHTLEKLKREGFEVTLLDVHENGIVLPHQVEEAIREIGAICRAKGVPFHTDAVQAAGHLPIHVGEQNLDLLSLSAHKFHGPKGVGVLYARKGIPLFPLIEGGAQERGRRAGTENLPAIMGMTAALELACSQIDENARHLTALRDQLIQGLAKIPHSVLNGDPVQRLPSNVNFCFEGIEGESLLLLLDDKGICASSGSACTSGSLDPSHVLLAIGRVHDIAHGSLRLSLSEETTEQEVEEIIRAVSESVAYLREMSPIWRDLTSGKKHFIIQ